MTQPCSVPLWRTQDRNRHFLIPAGCPFVAGSVRIECLDGTKAAVSPDWLAAFEVSEEQARRIAKVELGEALETLRCRIDEKVSDWRQRLDEQARTPYSAESTITPNAAPALFGLLKKLPSVIANSLSRDASRVDSAKADMFGLHRRLKDAGIELDDRFTAFPNRLAELRKSAENRQGAKRSAANAPPSDEK